MSLTHPLLLLLFSASASAESISLDSLPDLVRSRHPGLLAARLRVAEASARQQSAGRLANPSLGLEFQPESAVSPRTSSVSLDQSFPLTNRLRLEKQLSSQLVTAAELEVRDAERRLVAEAQNLAVQALALDRHLLIHQQQARLASDLVTFTEARSQAGEISPLDSSQARVDARRLDLETRQLAARRALLLSELKPLVGLPPSSPLSLSGTLPEPRLPASRDSQSRPDLQLAQSREHSAATASALAQARRWQDLSAGLFAAREKQNVAGQGVERTGFLGFRLSIPLPLWDRNQGPIAEAAASAERARLETSALAGQIQHEAAAARQDMSAQIALLAETRDHLLPLIAQQTAALEKAYQAGQTDLLSLLRAREQQLEAQTTLLDALRDFHLARIRYQTALGLHP